MKKTFILALISVLFVSCPTSFAKEIKPFTKVDFGSLLNNHQVISNQNSRSSTLNKAAKAKRGKIIITKRNTTEIASLCNCPLTQVLTPTKTSGSYVSFDLLGTRTSYLVSYRLQDSGELISLPPRNSSTNYGFGLTYKYAVNFNKFFIAPGIFFEQNKLGGAKVNGRQGVNFKTKNHFGVRTDFGYDLTDTTSPYLTFGYAQINYTGKSSSYDDNNALVTQNRKGSDRNWLYGAGLKIKFDKNTYLNFELTRQRFFALGRVSDSSLSYLNEANFRGKIDVMKLGLSYNF